MPAARPYLVPVLLVVVSAIGAAGLLLAADYVFDLDVRRYVDRQLHDSGQKAEALLYVYDPCCGWRMNPHTQIHRWRGSGPFGTLNPIDARLRTNSDGFFDREHALITDYYRVAFVGDSMVEAQQVDATNRFSNLTEDYVFRLSGGKKAVEVMNFGVSNHGTVQSYGLIKKFVLKYRPEEIWLFFFSDNDLGDNSAIHTQPPLGPTIVKKGNRITDILFGFPDPPAVTHEKVRKERYGKLINSYRYFQYEVQPYFYSQTHHPVMDEALENTDAALRLIKEQAARAGVKAVRLVYIPFRPEVDAAAWKDYRAEVEKSLGDKAPDITPDAGEGKIAAIAAKLGIEFLSLRPLIREHTPQVMFNDHFSRIGHHYVANLLAKKLIETLPDREWEGN